MASSHAACAEQAIAEISRAIEGRDLAGGIIFCSSRYPREELAAAIAGHLGGFPLVGCTSAGEITARGYDTDSLQFMGFPKGSFTFRALHVSDIDGFDREEARRQIRHLAANARQESRALGEDASQVALFLVDGLSHREELLTMTVQDALGDIPLIGGSSGDGLIFSETGVLCDGAFRSGTAVIVMLTSARPLHVFSECYYRPGDARMVVTLADPEKRIVHEINAAPAAEEYRRLAGSPGALLDTAFFAAHPPMVRTGGAYHVRSIQTANPDGSLTFYGAVDRGIVLAIGEPVDRIAQMEAFFEQLRSELGEIDHVLCFDCVLNRIDADSRQLVRPVSDIYAANRVRGFNTYGEQFRAAHLNQTLSGLAIGR
ncbi:FIST N-terminal domain-containing protein [Erythrobacter dokdonensis]|uniref:FIST N-terminal domain-containing protein n=1 Tax=Erythrobacter dokdonensis TaxID=328225 RepID=UPI00083B507C|nr:FIST N-terminal domain-containing protein [Erythrobacter dokdonensis]